MGTVLSDIFPASSGDSPGSGSEAASNASVAASEVQQMDWPLWIREHGPRLLLYARHQAGTEAEDVLQESLVKIWKEDPPLERRLPALFRTIRFTAIDRGRSRTRRLCREEVASSDPSIAPEPWFEEQGFARLQAGELQAALLQISEKGREVVTLRIWGGLRFREIGETLGVPTPTAAGRYRDALEKLRGLLDEQESPSQP